MAAATDSITTRLDLNPLHSAQIPVPVVQPSLNAYLKPQTPNATFIYDPILSQYVIAQNFNNGAVITAPVLDRAKQSVKWLIEHVPTASLAIRGSKILARKYSDGYYYPATIGSISPDREGNFIIEFDKDVDKLRMQKTNWYDMIALDDALTHSIQPGDFCIAPFEKNGIRYAPGRVIEGCDTERIEASIRHSGNSYQEEKKILVQFGKNITKNVRASKCIWLPDVVYERLCNECGREGRRDNKSSHITDFKQQDLNMGLISYSDIPVLPMPTLPGFTQFPIWNAIQPVVYNGGYYIPTYPYVWHQSLWPHMVKGTDPCDGCGVELKEDEGGDVNLIRTEQALEKIHVKSSDDEDLESILSHTDNPELKAWRAKRALKKGKKKKKKRRNDSCSSDSSLSSSDEEEYTSRAPTKTDIKLVDSVAQINCEPRILYSADSSRGSLMPLPHSARSSDLYSKEMKNYYIKRTRFKNKHGYTRNRIVEKPPWIKYWKHNKQYKKLPTVTIQDPCMMKPAGMASGRFMSQEEKLYHAEYNNADKVRRTHDKLSQQERAKVRLQQAREKRVLNRLQADLAREIGNSMPSAAVFSYNNEGNLYQFDHNQTSNNENGKITAIGVEPVTKSMGTAGTQTMKDKTSAPKVKQYSIGNQTFQETSVAVQVD